MKYGVIALLAAAAVGFAADRNIDYDVTIRVTGHVVCERCTDNIDLVILRRSAGDLLPITLSRSKLPPGALIDHVENYAWGVRVLDGQETPPVEIVVLLRANKCEAAEFEYSLSKLPLLNGRFSINLGDVTLCRGQ